MLSISSVPFSLRAGSDFCNTKGEHPEKSSGLGRNLSVGAVINLIISETFISVFMGDSAEWIKHEWMDNLAMRCYSREDG